MFFASLFLAMTACTAPADLKFDSAAGPEAEECASIAGMKICDFPAIDEDGQDAHLSQLYGKPIVLDLSAMWCGPCKAAGANTQSTADVLGREVVILTILIENEYGDAPSQDDLIRWKENYGIESEPVWGSSRNIIINSPIERKEKLFLEGWPTFYFIDSEGILRDYVKGYSEGQIIQQAELLLIE